MAVNENTDFFTELSVFLGKMVAPIAIFVGAAMKLGVDLIKKKKIDDSAETRHIHYNGQFWTDRLVGLFSFRLQNG